MTMFTTVRYGIMLFAGVLCLVFAGRQWGVVPAVQYKQDLKERYARNRERLEELLALRQELIAVRATQKQTRAFHHTSPDFTLFSFLEQLASQTKIKEHIKYMKPSSRNVSGAFSEDLVQMRLEDIRLAKLVRFVESAEYSGKGVYFKRLTIRSPKESPGVLRVDLLAGMYRRNE